MFQRSWFIIEGTTDERKDGQIDKWSDVDKFISNQTYCLNLIGLKLSTRSEIRQHERESICLGEETNGRTKKAMLKKLSFHRRSRS